MPKDNFFIIDSDNLNVIKTKLYGFSVQDSGIYDEGNRTEKAMRNLNGNGAYVYVESNESEIVIRQDFFGSYGIFLYNKEGRFVFSNSFLFLCEYLRTKVKLTLNRDYANHLLTMNLASMSNSQTLVNEITIMPRNAVIYIDTASKKFTAEYINYGENTISLDSREGIDILDKWFVRWTRLFKSLQTLTNNISIDLSGGMDSRMSFILMMKSGVDMNKICINSRQGKGYTLKEDYEVASEIAKKFGFVLNNQENFTGDILNYSLEDIINISFYMRMTVHNQLYYSQGRREHKRFHISGYNGEAMRDYWHLSGFVKKVAGSAKNFSRKVRKDIIMSAERISQSILEAASKEANAPVSDDLFARVFRDTWGRFHFGATNAASFISNNYSLCPLMDCELQKLKLDASGCRDKNLLMALIYARYCPELLTIRFNGKKHIDEITKIFAEKLSAEFPRDEKIFEEHEQKFDVVVIDEEVSRLLQDNNPPLPEGSPEKYLKSVFDSTALRKLFATQFDEEIYIFAQEYFKRVIWHPLARCSSVIAVTQAIKDVIISEGNHCGLMDDLNSFAHSKFISSSDSFTDKFLRTRLFVHNGVLKLKRLPGKAIRKLLRLCKPKH